MNQNYQPPPIPHHSQVLAPELPGPSAHLSGYPTHQLPPMVAQTSYQHYQNVPPSMHRPVPPRTMSGSRDHVADLGPPENGTDPSKTGAGDKKKLSPPKEVQGSDATRKYQLKVVQQPLRARMCGFGDKDRRPITPPPCIRLIVMDKITGKEVDCNEVDHQHYILHVDLWNPEGDKEANLVKHSQAQGSISATSTTSFRELVDNHTSNYGYPAIVPSNRESQYASAAQAGYGAPMGGYQPDAYAQGYGYAQGPSYSQQVSMQQAQQYNYPQGGFRNDMHPSIDPLGHRGSYSHDMSAALTAGRGPGISSQANGMYTRNLIGNLACSAARLTDPSEKIGIWFVLQDMSVRTEGWFRLRFSFINLRSTQAPGNAPGSDPNSLVKGKARVLAQVFSEPFQVYSAKKFPGVCESTALSKCFAQQGVKIPIRKEGQDEKGKGDGKGKDDSDNDD